MQGGCASKQGCQPDTARQKDDVPEEISSPARHSTWYESFSARTTKAAVRRAPAVGREGRRSPWAGRETRVLMLVCILATAGSVSIKCLCDCHFGCAGCCDCENGHCAETFERLGPGVREAWPFVIADLHLYTMFKQSCPASATITRALIVFWFPLMNTNAPCGPSGATRALYPARQACCLRRCRRSTAGPGARQGLPHPPLHQPVRHTRRSHICAATPATHMGL